MSFLLKTVSTFSQNRRLIMLPKQLLIILVRWYSLQATYYKSDSIWSEHKRFDNSCQSTIWESRLHAINCMGQPNKRYQAHACGGIDCTYLAGYNPGYTQKLVDNETVEKTAYEVSIFSIIKDYEDT